MSPQSGKVRISNNVINAMEMGQVIWDSELNGFGVRMQQKAKSHIVKVRIGGWQRWMTIGKHGSPWTPATARKRANEILRAAGANIDLMAEEKEQASQDKVTLKQVAEEFKEDHVAKLKPKSQSDYNRIIDQRIVPELGKREIASITKGDVARLHRKLSDKPRMANLMVSVFSKMMSWAEAFEYRLDNSNPCRGIKRYREVKRQRYLSMDEISSLGTALREAENEGLISQFAAAGIRLLIFTGARQGEILSLKWEYVDLERKRLWLPDSKTGQKAISLNNQAIEILESLPRLNRGGSVCLHSLRWFYKWILAFFMLPPGLVAAD